MRIRVHDQASRRPKRPPEAEATATRREAVVALGAPAASDPSLTGAKAAALATAAAYGLPVLPGRVITTAAPLAELLAGVTPTGSFGDDLAEAWSAVSNGGRRPLAVRSSSTVEDGATSSMAGVFTSVLDVSGWVAFVDAVATVLASGNGDPMAVLVQPMLDADKGGVLFGVDPVTGRQDQLVVEVVKGGPSSLVSGAAVGTRHVLTRRGRLVDSDTGPGTVALPRRDRLGLAHLASDAARAFSGPQDIEWAVDARGKLWLLQSRPVTAVGTAVAATGPRLGPGPVAETFPEPLTPLEVELWVDPLRAGIREALALVGTAPSRRLRTSPVVAVVGGRVAVDLDLVEPGAGGGFLRRLDPRPPARRLAAAWRVGRLRQAIPLLGADVVAGIDEELAHVPRLDSLDDDALLALIGQCRLALRAAHGQEVLAGMLGTGRPDPATGDADAMAATAAGIALRTLADARAYGLDDRSTLSRHPVVLALLPPSLSGAGLPATPPGILGGATTVADLGLREALRLRARWLQELSGRAAAEIGARLHRAERITAPSLVRWMRLEELAAVIAGERVPVDVTARALQAVSPPLPVTFRLTPQGTAVAERTRRSGDLAGRGAGGPRRMGPVHDGASGTLPQPGEVLVVDVLDPSLAPVLPGLAGLVAETGSVLSHLAILARELGVPTVVGVSDARRRFPAGVTVLVDGTTGEVAPVDGEAQR